MTKELIGAAIMLGVIGICYLGGVLYQAFADCARDSSEFPDQHEEEKPWPTQETINDWDAIKEHLRREAKQ